MPVKEIHKYLFSSLKLATPSFLFYWRGEGLNRVHISYLRERQSQMGSLAGAAHLLKDNTGVLR